MFKRPRIPKHLILEDKFPERHRHSFWPVIILTIIMGLVLCVLVLFAYDNAYADELIEKVIHLDLLDKLNQNLIVQHKLNAIVKFT